MKKFPLALSILLAGAVSGGSVILFDTGDPTVNTSAPVGALPNRGWQYQGDWRGYLGTPIAPSFFITAAHLGWDAG
ncbi:MAG TPA: hypothetical protein VJ719_01440, partial [Chthoniobacterales bacterium]|nr:hypothetical protein [Chthoniobacterales bacterium]